MVPLAKDLFVGSFQGNTSLDQGQLLEKLVEVPSLQFVDTGQVEVSHQHKH